MTDARTGPGRRPAGGEAYPGGEPLPDREEQTTDWGDASVSGVTPGQEETAPERTGRHDDGRTGAGESGPAVLVAGDGPGHETDAGRANDPGRGTVAGAGADAGRGTVAGPGADAGRETVAGAGRGTVAGPGADAGRGTVAGAGADAGRGTVVGPEGTAARETDAGANGERLIPNEECGQLEQRLHHAVAGFVDEPRAAVEEADRAVEELSARLTDAVERRRRALRGSWQADGGDRPGTADTEKLRLALRDYRELADRLLHI
ncbi:hypothetical protein [Streptomyces arenae]|uniref:hypothetical protein n=1 Tax=Streptomyces arenae TaxID=29301 RepID=UPI002657D492|nr:hypothetical protein [Streptomyces arenae]MCG7203925.1 hypothetical protein [Streptomyces arenae]